MFMDKLVLYHLNIMSVINILSRNNKILLYRLHRHTKKILRLRVARYTSHISVIFAEFSRLKKKDGYRAILTPDSCSMGQKTCRKLYSE